MKKSVVIFGLALAFSQQVFASASPTETLMELTEGTGEISSSSSGDEKMQARQLRADAEIYYADSAALMSNELSRQVERLQKQHPEFSTEQAVDFIYERLQHN